MKTTIDYLDELKAKHGGISDYRVAKLLGVRTQAVSKWRTGQDTFGDETAIKIAAILEVHPVEILAACHAERARTAETRGAWEEVMRKFGRQAAALALAIAAGIMSTGPAPAEASPIAAEQAAPASPVKHYAPSWTAAIRRRVKAFIALLCLPLCLA